MFTPFIQGGAFGTCPAAIAATSQHGLIIVGPQQIKEKYHILMSSEQQPAVISNAFAQVPMVTRALALCQLG